MAIKAAETLVGQFRLSGKKVPDALWFNPYALGVLSTTMAFSVKARFGDSLKPADAGRCYMNAFASLSNRDPLLIANAVNLYMHGKHPAFMEGVANAEKIIAVSLGSTHCDKDPEVVRALASADEGGSKFDFGLRRRSRQTRAASRLMVQLFHERLRKELRVE